MKHKISSDTILFLCFISIIWLPSASHKTALLFLGHVRYPILYAQICSYVQVLINHRIIALNRLEFGGGLAPQPFNPKYNMKDDNASRSVLFPHVRLRHPPVE